jgi:hypothetical protein
MKTATAYHEAGHAVAGHSLGITLYSATIVPSDDASGKVEHRSLFRREFYFDGSDRARLLAERYIMTCLAGPLAHRRYALKSWRRWHAEDDHYKARGIAEMVCGGRGGEEEAAALLRYLLVRTKRFVELPLRWSQIERVAAALQQRGKLTGQEIKREICAATEAFAQRAKR